MIETNRYSKLYEILDTLRIPLIYLVIIEHTVNMGLFDGRSVFYSNSLYKYISNLLHLNMGYIAVPFFFMVSAYFFFRKQTKWNWFVYAGQLKKRVKSLLIPYLLWNILIVAIVYAKYTGLSYLGIASHKEPIPSLYDIFWGFPSNFPTWYVKELMCMMLLAPLFYAFVRYTKIVGLVGLIAVYVWLARSLPVSGGLSMTSFTFFGIGAYLALYDIDLIAVCGKHKKLFAGLALGFLILSTWMTGSACHGNIRCVYILFGLVSVINLFHYLLRFPALKTRLLVLSNTTFFIYCAHGVLILNWLKGGYLRLPIADSPWGMILGYFLIPAMCMAICIGLYYLLKKISPKLLALLTGGRVSPRLHSLKN